MTNPYDSWNSRRPFIRVLNTESEEVPPFACMELSYTSNDCTEVVDGELHWKIKKPTVEARINPNRVLINSGTKIAANGLGISYADEVRTLVFADITTAPSPNQCLAPVAGQWYCARADLPVLEFLTLDAGGAYVVSSTQRTVWVTKTLSCSPYFVGKVVTTDAAALTEFTLSLYDAQEVAISGLSARTAYGNRAMFIDLVADDYATLVRGPDGNYYLIQAPCSP